MADTPAPTTPSDRDLASMAEARALARRARAAQHLLGELTQEGIDAIVDAMAAAVRPLAESLAVLAVEETGFGNVADKIQKNTVCRGPRPRVRPAAAHGRRHPPR